MRTTPLPHRRLSSSILILLCTAVLVAGLPVASAQNAVFAPVAFTDVPTSSPYYEAVEYLRTNNILKGYLDGSFRPGANMARSEFVTLMTNAFFIHKREEDCVAVKIPPRVTTVFFSDVPTDAPYATDVCVAVTHTLLHGYPDGTFRPDRSVSFVEAAKIISRIFALNVRRDKVSDEHWYTAYVQTLAAYHAIPATIDVSSRRSLARPVTRGEIALMLYALKTVPLTQ